MSSAATAAPTGWRCTSDDPGRAATGPSCACAVAGAGCRTWVVGPAAEGWSSAPTSGVLADGWSPVIACLPEIGNGCDAGDARKPM